MAAENRMKGGEVMSKSSQKRKAVKTKKIGFQKLGKRALKEIARQGGFAAAKARRKRIRDAKKLAKTGK